MITDRHGPEGSTDDFTDAREDGVAHRREIDATGEPSSAGTGSPESAPHELDEVDDDPLDGGRLKRLADERGASAGLVVRMRADAAPKAWAGTGRT